MLSLIMALVNAGLPLIANAVMTKGRDAIEAKTGIRLPDLSMGDSIPPEQLLALQAAEMKHAEFLRSADVEERKSETEAVSARWDSDNKTESWLTKNVRPVLMLALFSSIVLFAVCSIPSIGQPIAAEYIDLFKSLSQTAFLAYFGGRTLEKGTTTVSDVFAKRGAK